MATAPYSFGNRRQERESRNEFLGNVTLTVEEFDHARNAVSGTTRDGEFLTIRLADKKEYADLFVSRTKFTTQDARERVASKQTGNRPNTGTLEQKMDPGEGSIQMQSVKRLGSGELVAKWMESVSTLANDSYLNAQVRVPIPRSNEETAGKTERRRADIVLTDTATVATMDALDEFTSNRVTGHDGKSLDGELHSIVLVAVQAADDSSQTPTNIVWTPWDGQEKSFKAGGDSLFERPLNNHNWETMVPLAAQVGIAFDKLRFDGERVNLASQANARDLYEATKAGQIKVVITQGFTADTMPRLVDNLVASEREANESDGRTATMSDRGFFAADVGLRSRAGREGYGDQVTVKQILANEFLHPKSSESYKPRTVEALGERAIAIAEGKGMTLTLKPSQPQVQPRPQSEPEARPRSSVQMAPSI